MPIFLKLKVYYSRIPPRFEDYLIREYGILLAELMFGDSDRANAIILYAETRMHACAPLLLVACDSIYLLLLNVFPKYSACKYA